MENASRRLMSIFDNGRIRSDIYLLYFSISFTSKSKRILIVREI